MTLYPQVSMRDMAKICVASIQDPQLYRAIVFSSMTGIPFDELGRLTKAKVGRIRTGLYTNKSDRKYLRPLESIREESLAYRVLKEAMDKRTRSGDPVFGAKKTLRRRYQAVLERAGVEPHEWFIMETPSPGRRSPIHQVQWKCFETAMAGLTRCLSSAI